MCTEYQFQNRMTSPSARTHSNNNGLVYAVSIVAYQVILYRRSSASTEN